MMIMQMILIHRNTNWLCQANWNWLLPSEQTHFASTCNFISALLIVYICGVLCTFLWTGCSIWLVPLLVNKLNLSHAFILYWWWGGVQLPSRVQLFMTPWTSARQASLFLTISRSLPKFISFHWWCRPAISSSDALFSFCSQSFPASGTFPMSHLFTSDDQNTGASASASVLPVNIQGWSSSWLTGLISLLSKGLSRVFSTQFEGILYVGQRVIILLFIKSVLQHIKQIFLPFVIKKMGKSCRGKISWVFQYYLILLSFNVLEFTLRLVMQHLPPLSSSSGLTTLTWILSLRLSALELTFGS